MLLAAALVGALPGLPTGPTAQLEALAQTGACTPFGSSSIRLPLTPGSQPWGLVVGRLNGDTLDDVAVTDRDGNSVAILQTDGSGGFIEAPGSPVAVGITPLSVAAGQFDGDATTDLAVANLSSSTVSILLGNGSGGFVPAPGSPIPVGGNATSVVAGDFDGDLNVDLAVAQQSGGVTILLGDGTGRFVEAPGSPVPVGLGPVAVAAGRLNGDAHADLAVAYLGDAAVTILLGDGTGRFAAAPGSPVAVGHVPFSVAVGSFNRDANADLAVANSGDGTVTILLGDGTGRFVAAPGSPVAVGNGPRSVAVGSFNRDANADLAVANLGDDTVTILLGDGTGRFAPAPGSPVAVGRGTAGLAVGRFNSDGRADARVDLVVANTVSSDVSILLNECGEADLSLTVADAPDPVQDGTDVTYTMTVQNLGPDVAAGVALAAPLPAGTTLRTLAIPGGWSCTAPTVGSPGTVNCSIATMPVGTVQIVMSARVDAGRVGPGTLSAAFTISATTADPVSTNNRAAVDTALQLPPPIERCVPFTSQAPGSPVRVGNNPFALAQGNLNGDAFSDLAVANDLSNTVTILLGDGTGRFVSAAGSPITVGAGPWFVVTGRFNADGFDDLAVASRNAGTLTILLGNGDGSFRQAPGSPIPVETGDPRGLAVGFFNGDSHLDLAVTQATGLTVLLGNGSGGFSAAPGSPIRIEGFPAGVAGARFNADAFLDLAVANVSSRDVTILLGDGTGRFTRAAGSPVAVAGAARFLAVGSFDGDGFADLAVANFDSRSMSILLGDGAGGFTQAAGSPIPLGGTPWGVEVGEFNNDGFADLATSNFGGTTVFILLGDGTGRFTQAAGSPVAAGRDPHGLVVGSFNGDRASDLAVASLGLDSVTILLGNDCSIADLGVTVVDSPDPVAQGELLTFTITVENTGPEIASGVAFLDTLPTGLSFISLSAPSGWSCTTPPPGSGGGVTCSIATLPPGSAVFTLDAAVGTGPAVPSTITHVVTVSAATIDPIAANNSATVETSVVALPLTPTFTATPTLTPTPSMTVTPTPTLPSTPTSTPTPMVGPTLTPTFTQTPTVAPIPSPTPPIVGRCAPFISQVPGSQFAVGSRPFAIVVGSFNGDGFADLAVANVASDSVTILLGNGSGGFREAPGSPIAVPGGPNAVAVGQFDGDAFADLVVATQSAASVTILLGNGSGGFTPAAGSPVRVGGSPRSVVVGTFNGDGFADLAVSNGASDTVTILLGNGSGGFRQAPGSPIAVGGGPFSLAMGSFNGDSFLDLAVPSVVDHTVTILLGDGSGGFAQAPGSPIGVGQSPRSIAVSSFGGDAFADLVVVNLLDSSVTVLEGNGRGSFAQARGSPVSVRGEPLALTVGDFNGDAAPDLALVNQASDSITILLNGCVEADLGVTLADAPDPVLPGAELLYTVTVQSLGPNPAINVSLTDPLPGDTTFVSLVAPPGWTCTAPPVGAGGTVGCSIASLPVGSATFTLTVRVGAGVPAPSTLSNTVTVDGTSTDNAVVNNRATADTAVLASPGTATATLTPTPTGTFGPTPTLTQTPTMPSPTGTLLVLATPTPAATATSTPTATATQTIPLIPGTFPNPPQPTPRPNDDGEPGRSERRRESEQQGQQRQRTNASGSDDYRTEGNVVEVVLDAERPYAVIGTVDGLVRVLLPCDRGCPPVRVGDYLEADGEKIHELLFDAETVTLSR